MKSPSIPPEEMNPWVILGYHVTHDFNRTMTIRNHISQKDLEELKRQGVLKKVIADGYYQVPKRQEYVFRP